MIENLYKDGYEKTINALEEALKVGRENPDAFSIERHGSGWAIYRGRNASHHGYNLGQLTETDEATAKFLEDKLNGKI